jgi:hypothetical protein
MAVICCQNRVVEIRECFTINKAVKNEDDGIDHQARI